MLPLNIGGLTVMDKHISKYLIKGMCLCLTSNLNFNDKFLNFSTITWFHYENLIAKTRGLKDNKEQARTHDNT